MLAVLALIASAQAALLMRDSKYTEAIEVQAVHQSEVTTYNFYVTTEAALKEGYVFALTFPPEYTIVTATGCKIATYYTNRQGNQELIYTDCSSQISEFELKINLPLNIEEGERFVIQLEGVTNPNFYLSTGPFQMTVRNPKDSQILAENRSFDTLAFFPQLLDSYETMVIDTSFPTYINTAGGISDYAIEITHSSSLYKGTWYRLKLPTGWSKDPSTSVSCYITQANSNGEVPQGNFYCYSEGSYVYLKGLSSNIDGENSGENNYKLVFIGIKNPATALSSGAEEFHLDIVEEGTNIIIEQFRANSPQIVPGSFSRVSMQSRTTIAKHVPGASILETISVLNSNPIEAGGSITFTLDYGSWDGSDCYILSGISDISTTQSATCSITNSNKSIQLSNLGLIPARSTIQVQAIATLASSDSDTLTVTSFDSSSKTIDRSSASVLPCDDVSVLLTSYQVTLSDSDTGALSDIVIQFKPTLMFDANSVVYISIPSGFSASSVTCQQKIDSGSYSVLSTCRMNGNVVEMNLATIVQITNDCYIKLAGFTNPSFASNPADVYEFCANIHFPEREFTSNSACTSVTVDPAPVSSSTKIQSYIGVSNSNIYIPYLIALSSTVELDYETTRVEISIPMQDGSGNAGWEIDLGVSSLECSFKNLSNDASCSVIPADDTNPGSFATIVLENLGKLNTGTGQLVRTVFKAPQTDNSFTYKVSYGCMVNRVYRISSYSSSISYTNTDASSDCTTASISSRPNQMIETSTSLGLSLRSSSAVSGNDYLVMILPAGWSLDNVNYVLTDGVKLENLEIIDNSYAPAIVGRIKNNAGISDSADSSVEISKLINPRRSDYNNQKSIVVGISSSSFVSRCYGETSDSLDLSDMGTISATITADLGMQSFPGDTYKITLKAQHSIPDQGYIRVTLPTAFIDLSRLVVTVTTSQFGPSEVEYQLSNQLVTISNLPFISAGSQVSISLANLKNPNNALVSTFSISSLEVNEAFIDTISSITVPLPKSFSKGTVSIRNITMDPNNARSTNADFFLTFRTTIKLPQGSIIEVTTPNEYFDLPSGSCNLNFFISSCFTTGRYITVSINQEILPNTDILLSVNGIFSVPKETTDYFYIRTLYNGVVINESVRAKDRNNYYTPYPSSGVSGITIEEIDFYPKNQGEPAIYAFSLIINQELASDSSLVIWFPSEFDSTLTTEVGDINCWADPIVFVGSYLNCKVSGYRKVTVTGQNTLPKGLPFTIYMSNIRNPTKGKTGIFRVAVQDTIGNTLQYVISAGSLWMLNTPKPILMRDLSAQLPYARIPNTFEFMFGLSTKLPSNQNKGSIWIDFPSDYLLKNPNTQTGWEYPCTAYIVNKFTQETNPWSSSLRCVNFNSNRIEILGGAEIVPNPSTSLLLSISSVPGSQTESTSQPIKISTYDGVNGVLLDRTFGLLSYPLTLQFSISGEELTVNNNLPIIVPRGTCSDSVSINTQSKNSPMKVYLKISGNISSISNTSFYPDDTLLFPISYSSIDFNVCIPSKASTGSYFLEFNKSGDEVVNGVELYADIKSAVVVVTDETSSIYVPDKIQLPYQGSSFPISIRLERPPHSELLITPRFVSNNVRGIIFEPEYLQFKKGEDSLEIILQSSGDLNIKDFNLAWDISGKDADSYITPEYSLLDIIGYETKIPVIESINYSSTRKTAEFTINISEPGVLYYQIELADFPEPSPTAIIDNFKVNKASRVVMYDYTGVNTLTIDNLAAETKYILYATLQDRSENLSELYSLKFETEIDYASVKFIVDFDTFDPRNLGSNTILQEQFIPQLAKALAVNPNRLSFYSIIYEAVTRRELQSIDSPDYSGFSERALILHLANDKYSSMIPPAEIVDSASLSSINLFLNSPDLSISSMSKSYQLSNIPPTWYEDASAWDTSRDSITIVARLQGKGYIHMILQETGSKPPTAQQIVWGLDGHGNIAKHAVSYYDGVTAAVFVTYEGLSSDTQYDVYVAATNDYPGNNKAVSIQSYYFPKVRTELDDACTDCEKYMEVDETAFTLSACAVITYLALMA